MHNFDIIALTPPGVIDPGLAIAACRAGARGFLDLEYVGDVPAALAALERLERFTSGPYGVKIGIGNGAGDPLGASSFLPFALGLDGRRFPCRSGEMGRALSG